MIPLPPKSDARMPQHLSALQEANLIRAGRSRIRHDLNTGTITIPDVLDDPVVQGASVGWLLACQPRWGAYRAQAFCARVPVSEGRRVRELTERQRGVVVGLLGAPEGQVAA